MRAKKILLTVVFSVAFLSTSFANTIIDINEQPTSEVDKTKIRIPGQTVN